MHMDIAQSHFYARIWSKNAVPQSDPDLTPALTRTVRTHFAAPKPDVRAKVFKSTIYRFLTGIRQSKCSMPKTKKSPKTHFFNLNATAPSHYTPPGFKTCERCPSKITASWIAKRKLLWETSFKNCELKLWKRSYRTRLFLYKLQVLLSWSLSSSRLFCGLSSLQLHSALLSFLNFRTMEVSLLNFLWTIVTVGPSRVEYSTSAPKCDLEIGSLTLQLTLHPSLHHSAVR